MLFSVCNLSNSGRGFACHLGAGFYKETVFMEYEFSEEGMHYEGYCIRPPSEAESILLQVTLGCSHNKCAFCGSYKDKRFAIKDEETILSDILFASRYMNSYVVGSTVSSPSRKATYSPVA